MSPVNRAGSVSEISPHHSFLRKKFDVFQYMRSRAGPDTEIWDLGNRDENFPIWTLQPE